MIEHTYIIYNHKEKYKELNKKLYAYNSNLNDITEIILQNNQDKYYNLKNNEHHWTTLFVWEKFIPEISKFLNIPFNKDKFSLIKFIWDKNDLSYHDPIENIQLNITDLTTNRKRNGDFSIIRQFNSYPLNARTLYHFLFSLSHKSGIIDNLSINTDKILFINCDSMSVPVIPVLSYFFKTIVVIDKRTSIKCHYKNLIDQYQPDYFINIFAASNYILNKKHIKNLE